MKFAMTLFLIFGISTMAAADIHQDILNDFVNQVNLNSFNSGSSGSSSNWNNDGNGGSTGTTPSAQVPEPGQLILFITGVFIGWFFVRTAQQRKPSAFHVGVMFVATLFLFYLTITPAKAQVLQPVNSGITQNGNNQSASTSWSWSDSSSSSSSLSTSNSESIADAINYGNNQTINFEGAHRNSPSVLMGSLFPTAPCQATINGFLSAFIFGGVGAGTSYTLEQCEMREEARIAYGIGQHEMAKEILCMAKYAKETEVCKQLKKD